MKLFTIGQTGERNVLFELQNSMLPLVVLHDVYLEYKDYRAQLDFVIITHQFIMVLEVKKLFGNIHVTDKGEFQRVITRHNKVVNKEGMYSPINQVERHVAILEKLLKENGIVENYPVKYAVTFANPKTILDISKEAPASIQSSVIRHDQIKSFIKNELDKKKRVVITDQKVYEIAEIVLKYNKEKTFNIEDYQIEQQEAIEQDLSSKKAASNLTTVNSDLKKALLDYRLKRSKELNVKPYYIFTNKIVDSLLERKPQTANQLLDIEGIGQKKVEEFGEDIVTIINKYEISEDNKPFTTVKNQSESKSREEIKSALIAFRTRRSKELNVKPYYIFKNTTLESILDKRPTTIHELLEIEGIGPKKAEEFGQEIVSIIK
ncbi:HRDC domain-containing protein [Bacillus coahuilensis]|uniref:HRDC domain-containing protein n=1 Tax=Bacillus coahuilensis TaxID=408580 RepID=UPI000B0683E1|nr:HRDC domain-containing protein [Bacillus coahuilensis]